mmetsp:Transcript_43176/g.115704  ORF Transcript_43176/g.115704 Transcript_43176/m.115704 type:complete len:222 (+) Transcript_43176:50-715(+)
MSVMSPSHPCSSEESGGGGRARRKIQGGRGFRKISQRCLGHLSCRILGKRRASLACAAPNTSKRLQAGPASQTAEGKLSNNDWRCCIGQGIPEWEGAARRQALFSWRQLCYLPLAALSICSWRSASLLSSLFEPLKWDAPSTPGLASEVRRRPQILDSPTRHPRALAIGNTGPRWKAYLAKASSTTTCWRRGRNKNPTRRRTNRGSCWNNGGVEKRVSGQC